MSAKKTTTTENIVKENVNIDTQTTSQKIPRFPFLIRRFFEIIAVSIICSVPIALMYQFGFTRSPIWTSRLVGTSLIGFILINAYLLRAFFFSMGSRKIYFSVNAIAYLMFSVINILTLIFIGDTDLTSMYSYIFMPIKFIKVIIDSISHAGNPGIQLSCAILTHLIMLGVIVISPLEMYSFDKKKR